MSKTIKLALVLLMGGFIFYSSGLYATVKDSLQKKSLEVSLIESLRFSVGMDIVHLKNVPGLKPEEFDNLRSEIAEAWDTLVQEGVLEVSGTDKDIRPIYVALQGIVEESLSNRLKGDKDSPKYVPVLSQIKYLKGIIHTPMPATPLCTKGEISKDLVDPSIENDPNRLETVKARTSIIRDYLFKGADLYIIYPKPGYQKRTEEQRTIYNQELKNYPKHLHDVPLECESFPSDLIGATYLFQDQSGKTFVFGIKMTQANDPKDTGRFGLWFGPLDHPAIQKRVQAVSRYLVQNGCDALDIRL